MVLNSWPSLGINEKWIENGWTEAEMNSRAYAYAAEHELDLLCVLDPFYMNFLQEYGANDRVLYRWNAIKNLWTPGQTMNIAITSTSPADMSAYVKQAIMTHLQPHVSMKLVFVESAGTKADVTIDIKLLAKGGGNASLGKSNNGTGHVNLNTDRFRNVAGDLSRLDEPAHMSTDRGFILTRYLILHEFGHVLGLDHEWLRENCGSSKTCSAASDPFSVMNYFNQGTTGVQGVVVSTSTMDTYSPGDIEWLHQVYKGGTAITSPPTVSKVSSSPPPPTVGKVGSSPPPPPPTAGKVSSSPPPPPPTVGKVGSSPPPPPPPPPPTVGKVGGSSPPAKKMSTLMIMIIGLSAMVGVAILITIIFMMTR